MSNVFTNTHIHVFNDRCVSRNFLRVIPNNTVRRLAPQILAIAGSSAGRATIKLLAKLGRKKHSKSRTMTDKTIAFLNIALQSRQDEILGLAFTALRKHAPSGRVVALTMNMDHMDDEAPPMDFDTQAEEVKRLKMHHADTFFPFLGVDPRHRRAENIVDWAKQHFETGFSAKGKIWPFFSGVKLYPPLGFFPFDPALYPLYEYLAANEIPVMSHCTRVGSQYIGSNIEALIPVNIRTVVDPGESAATQQAVSSIQERISNYYERGWIRNNRLGKNDFACDLFTHPENYIPVLERFPRLKICLAHMGGSNEIYCREMSDEIREIRRIDPELWFNRIRTMMIRYPNLYTDISYMLSSLNGKETDENDTLLEDVVKLLETEDEEGNSLSGRVLFGTDFFMTEQEMREEELYTLAKEKLSHWWQALTVENPARFTGA